jgi:predicted GNAT family acetyltransferase
LDGDESLGDVWLIYCFYIKRQFRKKGPTALIIEEAKEYTKNNGIRYIEGYPVEADSPDYKYIGFMKLTEKQASIL